MTQGLDGGDLLSLDWRTVHERLSGRLSVPNALESPREAKRVVPAEPSVGFWPWVLENHRRNACLWDEEDLARRRHVPDADIVANKRAIDRHNQARNDAVERVDSWLLLHWASASAALDSVLHSETPGSMIDRLSILWLKIRAMRIQGRRSDLADDLRQVCLDREQVLLEQQSDLAGCLRRLLHQTRAGQVRFKLYRQFKMYNDPQLNPALVAESAQSTRSARHVHDSTSKLGDDPASEEVSRAR